MLESIKRYLRYEPDTGDFYWILDPNHRGPRKVGQIAGTLNGSNYVQIKVLGVRFYGHRLAWYFEHGYMPDNIDHINGKAWDNRIRNLRECTHARNIAAAHTKALGYEIHGARYRARIDVDGTRYELGSFSTPEAATAAYQSARQRLLGSFA